MYTVIEKRTYEANKHLLPSKITEDVFNWWMNPMHNDQLELYAIHTADSFHFKKERRGLWVTFDSAVYYYEKFNQHRRA